jgi:hypothetical protein
MDPFAAALEAQFHAPGSAAAAYQPVDGPPFMVRVICGRPDLTGGYGETEIIHGSRQLELQRSEVPAPADGDLIAVGGVIVAGSILGGELLRLVGDPISDVEGLSWRIGAEPHAI